MIQTAFEFLDTELLADEVITKARQRKPKTKAKLPEDNQRHRDLFSLPPIKVSEQTLPAVPELPPQRSVTGDHEIDAVIWLREVISTGQAALINKAMEAAKAIKTPPKELEVHYAKLMIAAGHNEVSIMFDSIGFADLESLAKSSIDKANRRHEAYSRFGDSIFVDTPAEMFCIEAMHGLETGRIGFFDDAETDERFNAHPDLMPHTLADCLHELRYWSDLYSLRSPCTKYYDSLPESYARENFVFRCLARIPPRNKDEAVAVFLSLDNDQMERKEAHDIILNLIRNAP